MKDIIYKVEIQLPFRFIIIIISSWGEPPLADHYKSLLEKDINILKCVFFQTGFNPEHVTLTSYLSL